MRLAAFVCCLAAAAPAAASVSSHAVQLPVARAAPASSPGTTDGQAMPAPPDPSPPVEVVGIVRSPAPGRSVAVVRSGGRTRVLAVGETAFGAKLLALSVDSATLEIDGRPVEKRVTQGGPLPAPPRPTPAAAAALRPGEPPEDPATPAREMDRQQVQARLGNEMNKILAETAIAPVMEDGRVVGVQLTRVPEGTVLTDAGLRAGDVVTRINDTQIDGMATLIGLWPRLQNATQLDAVVLRGGQPVSLHVALR